MPNKVNYDYSLPLKKDLKQIGTATQLVESHPKLSIFPLKNRKFQKLNLG